MTPEEAFEKTLEKWRGLMGGLGNPYANCGFCHFHKQASGGGSLYCETCPVMLTPDSHVVGRTCGSVELYDYFRAIEEIKNTNRPLAKRRAAVVVRYLENNKAVLIREMYRRLVDQ